MYLYVVLVPWLSKKTELLVNCRQEKQVQQPDVVDVIDVKPIVQFQSGKIVCPHCSNLSSDINPQALNLYIVHTPMVNVSKLSED